MKKKKDTTRFVTIKKMQKEEKQNKQNFNLFERVNEKDLNTILK